MFGNLHIQEIILIIVIILVIFGGKRLPELGRGLGRGLRNFRKALSGKDEPESGDQEPVCSNSTKTDPPDHKSDLS
jgi:sec-independent protein translocase protein TatA